MLTKDTFALNLQRQLKKSRNGVPSENYEKENVVKNSEKKIKIYQRKARNC